MAKTKERFTLKNRVVYDPITKRFTQKNHIVRGKRVLDYPIINCKNCSQEFPKKRIDQSFCSTYCRLEWHTKERSDGREPDLSPRPCLICSKTFTPTREWNKYCSEECRAKSRENKLKEARELTTIPSFRDTERLCDYCGKEYTPLTGGQRFCSKQCKIKSYQESGEDKICEYCGKSYKTITATQKYCSRSCASKAQKIVVPTEINQTKKEEKRKKYCRICGHRAYTEHHIIPRDEGGSDIKRNKVWLCKRCHNIIEEIYKNEGIMYSPDLVDRVRRMLGPDEVKRNYYEKTTNKVFVG